MEAPEKIVFCCVPKYNQSLSGLTQKCADTDIEYIRKDVFIEKACDWLKTHINDYLVKVRDIDYMFDDFRKAMED